MSLLSYHAYSGLNRVVFEPESIAYFARNTATLSLAEKISRDELIKGLKTANSLTHGVSNFATAFDRVNILAIDAGGTDDWKLDFLSDTNNLGTSGSSGVTNYEDNLGLDYGSISAYLRTPAYNSVSAASQNDFEMGGFITQKGTAPSVATGFGIGGIAAGSECQMSIYRDSSSAYTLYSRINNTSGQGFVSKALGTTYSTGMYSSARNSSTELEILINGVSEATATVSSSAINSGIPAVGQITSFNSAFRDDNKLGFHYIGAASLIDTAATYTAVRTWLLSRGITGI